MICKHQHPQWFVSCVPSISVCTGRSTRSLAVWHRYCSFTVVLHARNMRDFSGFQFPARVMTKPKSSAVSTNFPQRWIAQQHWRSVNLRHRHHWYHTSMIIFLLGVANEHIVPRRTKMDHIDHMLLWTIQICLVILFVTLPMALAEEVPGDNYWLACSGGDVEAIGKALEQNPGEWGNNRHGFCFECSFVTLVRAEVCCIVFVG